jgi:hypothetical protein
MVPHSLKGSLGAMNWIVNDATQVVSGRLDDEELYGKETRQP